MISVVWRKGDEEPLPKALLSMVSVGLEEDIIRIERCVCNEERVIWAGDYRDPWKNHFGYCEMYDDEA